MTIANVKLMPFSSLAFTLARSAKCSLSLSLCLSLSLPVSVCLSVCLSLSLSICLSLSLSLPPSHPPSPAYLTLSLSLTLSSKENKCKKIKNISLHSLENTLAWRHSPILSSPKQLCVSRNIGFSLLLSVCLFTSLVM